MKHTPGIWKVSGESVVASNGDYCIAVVESDGGYEAPLEQREANARLIAAAPELLEALEEVSKKGCLEYAPTTTAQKVWDAIAKAKGPQ